MDLERARRYAALLTTTRTALGVLAVAAPRVPARPWVGPDADHPAAELFGRAMGGRDLALGLGGLGSLAGPPAATARWLTYGGVADAVDAAVTVAAWRRLPRAGRLLVTAAAAGSAALSFLLAATLDEDVSRDR
ncbi:MAG: hypothetical protein ACJ73S_07010 [Mycobacteriales bacterium]